MHFDTDFVRRLLEELQPNLIDGGSTVHRPLPQRGHGDRFIAFLIDNRFIDRRTLDELHSETGTGIVSGTAIRWEWTGRFSDEFCEHFLQSTVGSMTLYQGIVLRPAGEDMRSVALNHVLENGYIEADAFKRFVRGLLLNLGKAQDELLRRSSGMTPDRLVSPHALGYAMKTGGIEEAVWSQYPYESDETWSTYLSLADGLLESVVQQLRTPYTKQGVPAGGASCIGCESCC
jgi:hypothetical protein